MAELTVGYVSGIVALFVFLVQFLVPSLFAFIAAGILRDEETAATWTAITPLLQQSHWTRVLGADVSRSRAVSRPVTFIIYATIGVAVLTALTGIITPLGLYDEFQPSSAQAVPFTYIKDPSGFGLVITPRNETTFTRICRNASTPYPCPYTDTIMRLAQGSSNGSSVIEDYPYGYDVAVPSRLREMYSSGTLGPTTVSNFFDIEWRQIRQGRTNLLNNGSEYAMGAFRQIKSLVLDDVIQVVEGLVVDTKSGGIGFRNHTAPVSTNHGATWTEDLLFVEPETACVNTNLTLEFTMNTEMPDFSSEDLETLIDESMVRELFLVDNGGFSELATTHPSFDLDGQKDPHLEARAYTGAWLHNVYTMFMLNASNPEDSRRGFVTFSPPNSTRGKRYRLPFSGNSASTDSIQQLTITNNYGVLINALQSDDDDGVLNGIYEFGDGDLKFSDARSECSGMPLVISNATGSQFSNRHVSSNISNIYVGCGLVQGAPQRIDGNTYFGLDNSGIWTVPLYSCASAVKAKVKEVTFQFNGTSDLGSLQVLSSEDKVYSTDTEMPLWGVESSNLGKDDFKSIWGLIDPAYDDFPNVSTVRKQELYLPGVSPDLVDAGFSITWGIDSNVPGYDFPSQSMESVFATGDSARSPIADYTGVKDLAMAMRWQDLSSTVNGTGRILNLIWTDIAASAVVGSKGSLGPRNRGLANETVPIKINPMERKIKYHLLFAIPAFILCLVLALVALATILSAALGKSGPKTVTRRLHQTSTGRLLTTVLYPQQSDLIMSSREWSRSNGSVKLDLSVKGLGRNFPYASDELVALREGSRKS